ncbi:hypothetical protein ElyMa_004884000 [Elysia marginata]|uniref:Uncharacterized protein n=1 Tax=Elysia marginata TaxID=1093978 RepID=A0AAV4IS96_9GAST|nr:hypothetical protein ElyMa_004884000 [Elysia marginata]
MSGTISNLLQHNSCYSGSPGVPHLPRLNGLLLCWAALKISNSRTPSSPHGSKLENFLFPGNDKQQRVSDNAKLNAPVRLKKQSRATGAVTAETAAAAAELKSSLGVTESRGQSSVAVDKFRPIDSGLHTRLVLTDTPIDIYYTDDPEDTQRAIVWFSTLDKSAIPP